MRILLVHNKYQQPGGEDAVLAAERSLLRRHNHDVAEYVVDNHDIESMSWIAVGCRAIWSRSARRQLGVLLDDHRPHVVHFHNTFPLISPAAYSVCRARGIPVVQTLHNFRLLCANAQFFRNGRPCEECVGRTPPWPAVVHACYHGSRSQSAAVATMLTFHRTRKTWITDVDVYITPTEFARQKFIAGGLPPEKLVVKPNFIDVTREPRTGVGDCFLFVGRLDENKGLEVLLRAWREAPSGASLHVVGDGKLESIVRRAVSEVPSIHYLGRLASDAVLEEMRQARALIVPSIWYETFALTIAEAFASGVPVIASRLGAMAELIDDGRTGILFTPGDAIELSARIRWAWLHRDEMAAMGGRARRDFDSKYTADLNYRLLMNVYQLAIERAQAGETAESVRQ